MTWFARICAAVVFTGLGWTILTLGADAYAAAQERTVQYRYFADALQPLEAAEISVAWEPAARPLVRDFTEVDEALVGRALGSAWRALSAAMTRGETALLPDYFSGVALHRAEAAAVSAFESGTCFAIIRQDARPTFYHLDGSVLQVEAEAVSVRFAIEATGLAHFALSRDRVTTTLMNETTGWRVFTHEMAASEPFSPRAADFVHPGPLAGVNYYPAQTPWRRFWPEFDAEVVDRDLALIAGLGANAVRIFLPVRDFAADDGASLEKLATFLRLARARGLRVVPTLFDMRSGYQPSGWADDAAYLRRVLPVLSASDTVAFVDLKNEPDLDFDAHGEGLVEAWLRTMSTLARDMAPDLALTVGWAGPEPAARFTGVVDVVSYHDYEEVGGTAERLRTVIAAAGGKPVYVTEIGASSFEVAVDFPGSPDRQKAAVATRLAALDQADGVFVWTLHDFETPDPVAVGGSPWVRRLQAEFGLFDTAGRAKPVAEAVAKAFAAITGSAR